MAVMLKKEIGQCMDFKLGYIWLREGEIMTRELYLYKEFISISGILNQQLDIVPVLYGLLGLGKEDRSFSINPYPWGVMPSLHK